VAYVNESGKVRVIRDLLALSLAKGES